jgi:hypothetical protein
MKPPLLQREQNALDRSIRMLFKRMLEAKNPRLTLDDVEAITVPVQHRQIARDVIKVMGLSPVDNVTARLPYIPNRKCEVTITFRGADWFWPDRRSRPDAWREAGEEVQEKYLSWLRWREELGAQWALVLKVQTALVDFCTNAEQIRFFWPALPTLLDLDREGKETAAKMRGFKYPRNLPNLPAGLIKDCTETMQTITKGLLFADTKRYEGPVTLELYSPYHAFDSKETSWGKTYTVM